MKLCFYWEQDRLEKPPLLALLLMVPVIPKKLSDILILKTNNFGTCSIQQPWEA
jgi:hypothetical protein